MAEKEAENTLNMDACTKQPKKEYRKFNYQIIYQNRQTGLPLMLAVFFINTIL